MCRPAADKRLPPGRVSDGRGAALRPAGHAAKAWRGHLTRVSSTLEVAGSPGPLTRLFHTLFFLASLAAFGLLPAQRALAALVAMSRRCFADSLAARAGPPLRPPRRPSDEAYGFFWPGR